MLGNIITQMNINKVLINIGELVTAKIETTTTSKKKKEK